MKYFLGIDGGGTKTAYLLTDETGRCIAQERTEGCSYKEIGIEGMGTLLKMGTDRCLKKENVDKSSICAMAIGLPCFGEVKEADRSIRLMIKEKFPNCPVLITNDVEAGWAGSLGMRPGINIVAGTGSIAFGRNASGHSARCGGWSTFFGDEGSCYWLGRKMMELFSKQADGRMKKGPLYQIVMKDFQLKDDVDFIGVMEKDYIGDRSRVASLQKLLLRAALQGDPGAEALYKEAGEELGMMVKGVMKQLEAEGTVLVSYSGGLFHAGDFVLPTLQQIVEKKNGILQPPLFSPVQGAVLLAMSMESEVDIISVRKKWAKERGEEKCL